MSSVLKESTNYVWCTEEKGVLGKGATAAVYQGVNKHNGKPVAVKVFHRSSCTELHNVQMRELEMLRKMKHNNIVKLLDIEDDQEGRGKVIVMELCTGGSLLNILDDPENTYGLPQREFLLVLEHLSAGMKHLRDNNLVHRDLKPGNIVKNISEDGRTIYKLTDFGAARELEENQQFVSLYGTEEYLHPDMYERAVLRKSTNRSFTANVDLWSIGVTLYHVATGNLPFRPFGGRKNKKTMHHITTKKEPGIISGTQTSENSPIEWSRDLPLHCQLKAGLKYLVTPLLAGLLEVNQTRMWSFDRFFREVQHILNRKRVNIFYANRATSIEVYMDPKETCFNLKEHIFVQTAVPHSAQLLLMDTELHDLKVGADSTAHGYPESEAESPLMLFNIEDNNVSLPAELDLPKFPSFPSGIPVESDANLAKVACSVGHEYKRRIETFSSLDTLMNKAVEQFAGLLKSLLMKLQERVKHFEDMGNSIWEIADLVEIAVLNNDSYQHKATTISTELKVVKADFQRVSVPVQKLFNRFVLDESLSRDWITAYRDLRSPNKHRVNEKAKHLVDCLRESWQNLLPKCSTCSLIFDDEKLHALEKMTETGKRVKALLNDDVRPAVGLAAECFADWYKKVQTIFLQTQFLHKDVKSHEGKLHDIREQLIQIKEDLKKDIKNDGEVSKIANETSVNEQNIECMKKSKERQCYLKTLFNYQREIEKILQQNSELIETVQQLSMNR
ncbi:serine/threonine-protein kinase TBK1-like [Sabethes cyaneus]|uniref:serine/threonine-protein kinase TBK1-like n=1 Tax=Sabethes cyaneus TaxID=53552 RepID=UPI00237D7126|nr:serine/threonine-protein kinase TBK1-like [Sabethes cyaneus]